MVVTKQRRYRVSPDGTLWAKVLRKVDALHPKPRKPLTLDHHRSDHATGEWATVLSPGDASNTFRVESHLLL